MVLKRRIIYGGLWGDEVLGVEAPKRETAIMQTNHATAARIIRRNHYSKKTAGITSPVNLLVLYKGQEHGALMLGYGVRPDKNGTLDDMLEFDRMWLSDEMPKLSETCVIGLLHTYLRAAYPNVKRITTYADTGEGNYGTIYKAANYRRSGEAKGDFYRLVNGEKVHPVTMWHWHGTRAWGYLQQRYPGIQRLTAPQLRFVYDL